MASVEGAIVENILRSSGNRRVIPCEMCSSTSLINILNSKGPKWDP